METRLYYADSDLVLIQSSDRLRSKYLITVVIISWAKREH
jgi:hypothetical protein